MEGDRRYAHALFNVRSEIKGHRPLPSLSENQEREKEREKGKAEGEGDVLS